MTKEEIIRMAQEAGLICESRPVTAWIESTDLTPYLTRFASLVATHEREACAKVCDEKLRFGSTGVLEADKATTYTALDCAAAIRARSDK